MLTTKRFAGLGLDVNSSLVWKGATTYIERNPNDGAFFNLVCFHDLRRPDYFVSLYFRLGNVMSEAWYKELGEKSRLGKDFTYVRVLIRTGTQCQ
jgi:hypothetical protein